MIAATLWDRDSRPLANGEVRSLEDLSDVGFRISVELLGASSHNVLNPKWLLEQSPLFLVTSESRYKVVKAWLCPSAMEKHHLHLSLLKIG